MEVIYTLTKEDALGFQQFHARGKGKVRWLVTGSRGLCVVVWFLLLSLVASIVIHWRFVIALGPRTWGMLFERDEHILVIFLIFSLFLIYMFWGQKILRVRQIPDHSVLSLPKRMRIGPDGVEVVSERECLNRSWGEIKDIGSDTERLYLYVTPTRALIVPKCAFGDPEIAQAFEAQARAYRQNPYVNGSVKPTPKDVAVWPPPPQPIVLGALEPEAEPDDIPGAYHLQYVTRKADLWRSQLYLLSRRPAVLCGIFIPYVLAVGLWVWSFGHLSLPLALLGAVAGASAATLLTVTWTTHKALNLHFARFADGRPCRTTISPEMIWDVTPDGRTMYRWPEVKSIRFRFGDLYVLAQGHLGVVIPRTAFPDKRAAQEFLAIIERFWRESHATVVPQPTVAGTP